MGERVTTAAFAERVNAFMHDFHIPGFSVAVLDGDIVHTRSFGYATIESSRLNFWREMLELRKKFSKVFIHGIFELVDQENPDVLSFTKTCRESNSKVLVVCNFSDSESRLPLLKSLDLSQAELLRNNVSELKTLEDDSRVGFLEPWESRVYLLRS
jgi:oligo-1,6-glucosidase